MFKKMLFSAPLALALSGLAFAQDTNGKGYIYSSSFDDNGGPLASVYHSQRVVYHVDEPAKFKLLLANVQNHIDAFKNVDAELEIVVVANGDGYGFLLNDDVNSLGLDNPWVAKVMSLENQGVTFEICNNTMNAAHLLKSDLLPGINVVPAAVATLTELQMRGYAYIHP